MNRIFNLNHQPKLEVMKKSMVLLCILTNVAFSLNAQKTIRSIKLDSAVFNLIKQIRIENKQPSVLKFFNGTIRSYSYRITDQNCDANFFAHGIMDTVRKYSNGECIFQNCLVFGDASQYDIELHPENIATLAQRAVDAWMGSPDHKWCLLLSWNRSFTITSQIEIAADNKKAVLSVSYHAVQHTAEIMELPYGLRDESAYYLK
jgi:uncharacterized protein YkwD